MSSTALIGIVILLIAAAVAVQVYYVLGIKRSGIQVSKTVIVISVVNIVLLAVVAFGLIAFLLMGTLAQRM